MVTSAGDLYRRYRSIPIVYRIAIAFVLGSIVGLVFGERATALQPLGDLFVRLLKMIIVPIVVFTLIMAARTLTPSNLGKIGGQVVIVYLLTTAIAIGVGLVVSNVFDPGMGVTLTNGDISPESAPPLSEVLLGIIPENPIHAMAEGNMLGIISFSLIFGIGMSAVREETDPESSVASGISTLFDIVEAGAEVMFKVVWGVMEYGVIGVFALMAALFGQTGPQMILDLITLAGTLLAAVLIQITLVYLVGIIWLLVGSSPVAFVRGVTDAMVTALSIRSSSGTLPVTMSNADENLGVEESVYGFSLPLGATINMDGTAMYLGIAAIFTSNVVGVHLSIAQQLSILLTALLASIGTAGVPGASLVMMTVVFSQVGLPVSAIAMVAGIDPLLDRLRTMNNVTGDLAVTTLVANWNDAIDRTRSVLYH
ncbi:dicarboxylate/amino acid:cation symporter [Halocatena halophila]|uniref:dicarboxylate/amino acid:cation symporter n=1 Tax=Halocatena halophila TaxID=2814576 RepID=UPI002ECFB1F9